MGNLPSKLVLLLLVTTLSVATPTVVTDEAASVGKQS
jgi:hypothetical protein